MQNPDPSPTSVPPYLLPYPTLAIGSANTV